MSANPLMTTAMNLSARLKANFVRISKRLQKLSGSQSIDDNRFKTILETYQDEALREEYAQVAMSFFIQHYFSKEFDRFAVECEMDVPECIASLSYGMADAMILARR